MTQTTKQQYEAALARADKLGVRIMGRGRWTTGAAFFLVSSASAPAEPRIVTVGEDGTETCNCPSRLPCTHRAVVRRQLAKEAAEIAAHMERIREAMEMEREAEHHLQAAAATLDAMDRRAEAQRKAEADRVQRDTSPVMRPAVFSMWAAS